MEYLLEIYKVSPYNLDIDAHSLDLLLKLKRNKKSLRKNLGLSFKLDAYFLDNLGQQWESFEVAKAIKSWFTFQRQEPYAPRTTFAD